jgi:predicted Fe-Mo cluster-binding NifX family protein
MKIAIASEGEQVTQHFGHCEHFVVYEVENGEVKNKESVKNPGHKPGFLPVFLSERGVNVIVSGGMGGGAIDIFNEKNIEVIIGAQGSCDSLIAKYISGDLESTGSVCHQHEHSDECDD